MIFLYSQTVLLDPYLIRLDWEVNFSNFRNGVLVCDSNRVERTNMNEAQPSDFIRTQDTITTNHTSYEQYFLQHDHLYPRKLIKYKRLSR